LWLSDYPCLHRDTFITTSQRLDRDYYAAENVIVGTAGRNFVAGMNSPLSFTSAEQLS
jgi:hypothetical protein